MKHLIKQHFSELGQLSFLSCLIYLFNNVFENVLLTFISIQTLIKSFSPLDTVNKLVGFLSNCTHRIGLLLRWCHALITLCEALLY